MSILLSRKHGYLTSGIPGIGGVIKETPEDFCVTEIPAYEPSGMGEHVYLTIEKRGITTLEAVRRVSRELKVPEKEIGYAGMKDSIGVTRQTLSLQRVKPEALVGRELDGIRVISAERHGNKLKLGHLKGNRFRIIVRGVSDAAAGSVPAVMDILVTRGVPNWFGYQRYGIHGNSHMIGRAMLQRDWHGAVDRLMGEALCVQDEAWKTAIQAYQNGDYDGALKQMPRHCRSERDILQRLSARPDAWEKAFAAVHPRLKKLYLSAYQSSLFDCIVNSRLEEIDRLWSGDLAWKHANGACFLVQDLAAEAARAAMFEISATGPMFGARMKQPEGRALELEQQILAKAGVKPEDFDLGGGLKMEGERRPLRVPLGEPSFQLDGDSLILEFSLPKGSYATSVVRELTKSF